MKKKIKYILLGAIVLVILSAIVVNALQPLAVDVVVAEQSRVEVYFNELGHVRADRQVDVFSLVGGEIISVHVSEGQFVQEGDVLVIIDPSETLNEIEEIRMKNREIYAQIDNLAVEEAQAKSSMTADRNVLQGALSENDANERISLATEADQQWAKEENIRLQNIIIEQSRTNAQNAYNDLESARILYNAGLLPKAEFEAFEQTLEKCRTTLAEDEQMLEVISSEAGTTSQSEHYAAIRRSIQTQIGDIESSYSRLSKEPMQRYFNAQIEGNNLIIENLEKKAGSSTITSPLSGTIVELPGNYTNIVSTATPVASISIKEDALIEVFVSTANINDLAVGDTVNLTFARQNGDDFYSGTIHDIDDRAEATVSTLGVEERKVKVLIKPDSFSNSLKSGFDVDVRFVTYSAENSIAIPRTAVFEEAGQSMVYIIENSLAVAMPVELGVTLRTDVVVESGVTAGDIIIRDAQQNGLSQRARVSTNASN